MEKILDQLKPLLEKLILAISMDGQLIKEDDENTLFGENICIYFSDNKSLQITTDDIPHFYGEGDLDLEFENSKYTGKPISKFKEKKISEIRIYAWERKGVNLFKAAKYFVQIEFYHHSELLLSSGFFYFDHSTNSMECLITGELSINFTKGLSTLNFEKNLSVATIA